MRLRRLLGLFAGVALGGLAFAAHAEEVVLAEAGRVAAVVHDKDKTLSLAGSLLARDLKSVTGQAPVVSSNLADCRQVCVVVGQFDSALVRGIARDEGLDLAALKGQWERYERVLVRSKRKPGAAYLLIAGSDTRGAVWGVIDLTREMGVSAWEWWADVTPRHVDRLVVNADQQLSKAPHVQYRGIFLNDEDWALQPWAAKTYEPEVGDIGPKTYSRIFELLWRLKANTIWPAMHDSTKPFYQIKGNAETAAAYGIVVGTSHAEPMMRNNVREWDDAARGEFNFFTNPDALTKYWAERAEEVKDFDNIYTIGLRGKHDSGMEGARTPEQARDALTKVFGIQRDLLSRAQKKPATEIPQVLTLYKEVLDIYQTGLKVPDDVTLIWPEDNYGYINQLSNAQERQRSGGSGIYYHLSYWGRPHDYLWLSTTHPALIREQLDRASRMDATKIWIANVGDIKPAEFLAQYFLDLAFDADAFRQSPREHYLRWARDQFGAQFAERAADIMFDYYDLAFERRPEFMGFSQTEPTRPNVISDYVRTGGDEAWRRLDRYAELKAKAEALAADMPADRKDAFFQLVLYPVRGAANINERILKLDLAAVYAKQGRASVNGLSDEAKAAHARIVADTAAYNAQVGGKWRGMMDMAPRRLPVFDEPIYPQWTIVPKAGCTVDATGLSFVTGKPSAGYISVYTNGQPGAWSASGGNGVTFGETSGQLTAANGFHQRVRIAYDGSSRIDAGSIACGGRPQRVTARLLPASAAPVEVNRIVSIPAAIASSPQWEVVPGLGSRGAALRSSFTMASTRDVSGAAPLVYEFETSAKADATLKVVGLPVHPLTSENHLRLAIRLDGGALQVLDFETFGRSEEWKLNVLSNTAVRTLPLSQFAGGKHRLEVYAMDPGFILDRIDVALEGAPNYYGAP